MKKSNPFIAPIAITLTILILTGGFMLYCASSERFQGPGTKTGSLFEPLDPTAQFYLDKTHQERAEVKRLAEEKAMNARGNGGGLSHDEFMAYLFTAVVVIFFLKFMALPWDAKLKTGMALYGMFKLDEISDKLDD